MTNNLGMLHFINQADAVAWGVLAVLVGMSVCSWFVLAQKTWRLWAIGRQAKALVQRLDDIQQAPTLHSLALQLQLHTSQTMHEAQGPFSALAAKTLAAAEQYAQPGHASIVSKVDAQTFLENTLARSLDEARANLEHGQTLLASVASCAPFVGLFGTVWGIYHALVNIGISGQASLDKVAGPVGEALIMTALGLVVAIPALLAFNGFARSQRAVMHNLEGFAHDLFGLLCTGRKRECLANQLDNKIYTNSNAITLGKTRERA
jgi:biopolymer transport protein ExbB